MLHRSGVLSTVMYGHPGRGARVVNTMDLFSGNVPTKEHRRHSSRKYNICVWLSRGIATLK